MKTISVSCNKPIAFGLLLFCWSCKPNDNDPIEVGADYYISDVIETSKASNSESSSERKYVYNEQMRLKEINYSYRYQLTGGAGQVKIENKQSFTYNADSFLMKKTETELLEDMSSGQKTTTEKRITTNCTYLNDRLYEETVLQSITKAGSVVAKTLKINYLYGADNKLTKKTSVDETGLQRVWTFENGQLTDYTQRTAAGAETHPYFIKNGLVEKESYSDGRYVKYDYDEAQRLVKYTLYVNDTDINYYYTQAWGDGKSHEITLPAFKGHPDIPAFLGKTGILTGYTFYADFNGKLTQFNESNYVNELNEKGLVKNTLLKNQQFGTLPGTPAYIINSTLKYNYLKK